MSKRQLLLLSSSKVHGYEFLGYALEDIKEFFAKNNVTKILFIPYALKDHDGYLKRVSGVLEKIGLNVTGIHQVADPGKAVLEAEGIFIGGGNTFRLLKMLYESPKTGTNLVELIRRRVLHEGIPYMGASAGTNVATRSINTTNDMPIVHPPTFDAMNLVPFNINPHYIESDPTSKHKGETREERIEQYFEEDVCSKVLGLREGDFVLVDGDKALLKGISKDARLFVKGEQPKYIDSNTDISYLLEA